MQKIEILGLLIFILMAVIMLTVGAALFSTACRARHGSAGMQVELGLFPEFRCGRRDIDWTSSLARSDRGLSLVALYMLSGFRGGA